MLRIIEHITPDIDIEVFDFTLLTTLTKMSPTYEKGRKTKSKYTDYNGKVVVEKIFTDIKDEVTGCLKSLSMTINWLNDDDSVGITKTQIVKNFNKSESMTALRKRRERSIDYLQASAEGTAIENYVKALFKRYSNEIQLFISADTDDFLNSLNNETDAQYIAYLNIVVGADNYTVKDSIINQITNI